MGPEQHHFDLPDASLTYHQAGAARTDQPTLVFLHYFGGSSRTWDAVINELAADFPCVALDLRGSGESKAAAAVELSSLAYSLDMMAGDVAALVGHLGCRRYVVVGHSMGGKVALALAARHGCPADLEALVLVAPSPPSPEPMPEEERQRLLDGQGSASAARETLEKTTARPLSAEQTDAAVEDQVRVAPAAWRAWLEYGSKQDITDRLKRIKMPVRLLAGEQDANITASLLRREVTKRLPAESAREPETAPGAAHLLPLEAPVMVADFIRRSIRV